MHKLSCQSSDGKGGGGGGGKVKHAILKLRWEKPGVEKEEGRRGKKGLFLSLFSCFYWFRAGLLIESSSSSETLVPREKKDKSGFKKSSCFFLCQEERKVYSRFYHHIEVCNVVLFASNSGYLRFSEGVGQQLKLHYSQGLSFYSGSHKKILIV